MYVGTKCKELLLVLIKLVYNETNIKKFSLYKLRNATSCYKQVLYYVCTKLYRTRNHRVSEIQSNPVCPNQVKCQRQLMQASNKRTSINLLYIYTPMKYIILSLTNSIHHYFLLLFVTFVQIDEVRVK